MTELLNEDTEEPVEGVIEDPAEETTTPKLLKHKHLIVRAEVVQPLVTENEAINWMREMIHAIRMKIFMGPYAKYSHMVGNRGLTAAAIIETSHVVMHCWDEVSPALIQLDVYSCADFEPEEVLIWLAEFYPVKIEWKFIDRENGLHEAFSRGSSQDVRELEADGWTATSFPAWSLDELARRTVSNSAD